MKESEGKSENANDPPPRWSRYYRDYRHTSINRWDNFLTGADSSQLTQGGSKVRRLVNQISWEGSVQNYVIRTGISEEPDLRKYIFKYGFFF